MKHILAALTVGILVAFAGCTRWNFLKPDAKTTPPPTSTPSVAQLVGYLDENSGLIQTVRCTDLNMTCWAGRQSVGVNGRMIAQKPRNFLMGANSLGKTMVDIGSNDQEFWYWISKADPPYQFYCSYKDLQDGRVRQVPFPFQPDWIIETMGMGTYGPPDRYKLEVKPETLELVESARSPQGVPVRKVIVLNRREVKVPAPQVLAYLLLDEATGKEICSAHITESQLLPVDATSNKGIILPRRIEFRWNAPNQSLKLEMRLYGVNVNPQIPRESFARRPLQGVPSYDLASGRKDQPAGLQRVQGLQ
jgi:hypothetical protein